MEFKKMSWVLACVGFMFLDLCKANGNTHCYDFVLTELNFTRLCETKTILTVNGTFPGPTITVRKGRHCFCECPQPRLIRCHPSLAWSKATTKSMKEHYGGMLIAIGHVPQSMVPSLILPALNTTYPFTKPDGEETLVLGSWYKGDVNEIIENAPRNRCRSKRFRCLHNQRRAGRFV
ncbi:hypothetical protein L3X38_041955 [Prunus dulcis]|uniref:Plastocyanin-like domain-containing protein n=1 Tax=Prunus dulcis TaxID=3755 RepID=A0AAD4UVP8_PRUDU|nr:hypothetical protein L3X38_041955 [Prunus dulcis]